MIEYGLAMCGVNPVHYGHIALIQSGLKNIRQLDILIGLKKIYALPWEIRADALRTALQDENLDDRVNILPLINGRETKLLDYDLQKYEALLLGSDVLNHFPPSQNVHRPQDKALFSKFNTLVILQREGMPITDEAKEYAGEKWDLIIHQPKSSISAKQIRAGYRNGEDISEMMPSSVWKKIRPHAELFKTSKF